MKRRKHLFLLAGTLTVGTAGCLDSQNQNSDSGETEDSERSLTDPERKVEQYFTAIRTGDQDLFEEVTHEESVVSADQFEEDPTLELNSVTEKTVEETVRDELEGSSSDVNTEEYIQQRNEQIEEFLLGEENPFEEVQYVEVNYTSDGSESTETLLLAREDDTWYVLGVLFQRQSAR